MRTAQQPAETLLLLQILGQQTPGLKRVLAYVTSALDGLPSRRASAEAVAVARRAS